MSDTDVVDEMIEQGTRFVLPLTIRALRVAEGGDRYCLTSTTDDDEITIYASAEEIRAHCFPQDERNFTRHWPDCVFLRDGFKAPEQCSCGLYRFRQAIAADPPPAGGRKHHYDEEEIGGPNA